MGIQDSIREAAERQKAMADALRKESEEMAQESEGGNGEQTTERDTTP